jgi:RHS repeat-associated protein
MKTKNVSGLLGWIKSAFGLGRPLLLLAVLLRCGAGPVEAQPYYPAVWVTPQVADLCGCTGSVTVNVSEKRACGQGVTILQLQMGAQNFYNDNGWVDNGGSNPDCNIVQISSDGSSDGMAITIQMSGIAMNSTETLQIPMELSCCGDNAQGQWTNLSENVTFNVTIRTHVDCSPCNGACTANSSGSPNPAALGSGSARNNQGPSLDISAGSLCGAQNAGILELNVQTPGPGLSSPAALSVPFPLGVGNLSVMVVSNGGVISQVASPQGLINVVDTNNGYLLQVFTSYNTNFSGTNIVSYSGLGSPYDVWTITNGGGNANILGVSESLTGHQFTYTYTNWSAFMGTNYGWQMADANNLRTVLSWNQATNVYGGISATNFVQAVLAGSTLVQETQKFYGAVSGCPGSVLLQEIDGSGAVTNLTTYYYVGSGNNGAGMLAEVTYPDGSWMAYAYDSYYNMAEAYAPYGNCPAPSPGTVSPSNPPAGPYKVTYYTYPYESTFAGDDVSTYQPSVARLEIVEINTNTGSWEQEVSRLYRSVPVPTEVEVWQCPLPGVDCDYPSNLRTVTATGNDTADLNLAGKPLWQVNPNGTATIYTYLESSSGILTNVIIQTGAPDNTNAPNYIVDGTLTSNVLNSLGGILVSTTMNVSNSSVGPVLSQQTYTYTDVLQRNYQVVDLANRTTTVTYACCGLDTTTDPDGVLTEYQYDPIGRLTGTIVLRGSAGISTENTLDAAGRVVVSEILGTNYGTITNQGTAYDVLGRPIYATNALGGVTSSSYAMINSGSQLVTTTVNPDGGTSVTTNYSDGRAQGVGGTAVPPVTYQYGVGTEVDGNLHEYTLTTKLSASRGRSEWTKAYTDGTGRSFETIYAASAAPYPYSTLYYNGLGQLIYLADPDGVGTLYGYDDQGRQVYTAVDFDHVGNLNFAGTNHITLMTNDVVTDNGTTVNRTQVFVWSTIGSPAATLVSTAETSANGLKTWNITWNNGGAQGVTNQTVTAYSSGNNRTVTNMAADGSYSVSAYQYGQLLSTTRYDANYNQIGQTTYGYDQFGRQNTATDARTGTTTTWFNNMGAVSGTATPAPALGQSPEVTTNYFDNMGRVVRTTLPDLTSVTNVYYPTGLTATNCGSRTYPVAYTYDAHGRMTTMTTWTNFAAGAGAATTAWNYDAYRGLLSSKVYTNGSGPSYTYTAAGRLKTRLWARGTTTTYLHDPSGNLTNTAYSDGTASVANGYDRRGRLVAVTNGPTGTSLALNDAGELLSETNSGGPLNGLSITNGYDALLRRVSLTALNSSTPLLQYSMSFDAASRLLAVSDGTNSAAYSYLANSALVGQIVFANNGATQMTASKTYDNLNRLTGIVNGNGTIPPVDRRGYAYNSANQRTGMTNVDGSYWVYAYDSLGQVTSGIKRWSDGTLVAGQQFDYTFDTIGNRTSTKAGGDANGANLRAASYANNSLNELTSRDVPGYADVMGLTLAANTVSVNGTNAYQRYEYFREQLGTNNSAAPQWMGINVTAPGQTTVSGHEFIAKTPEVFAYDADGNLTNDGRWSYYWDGENRLVAMTNNASIPASGEFALAFSYDYQGRRIQKLVSTNNGSWVPSYTDRFLYDGWNPVAILNPAGSLIASMMWGTDLSGSMQGAGGVGGLLAENLAGNGVQFAAYDANGNVAALVSASSGTVTANYEYGPFGELIRATGPMAKLNPIRFSTKYQDDETGLLYYGYRYYNPSTGRWPNRDPLLELTFHVLNRVDLDEDTDFNIYELLGNDPLSKIDMLGAGWRCYCDAEASLLPPGSEFMHRVGDDAGNSIECTDSTQGATVTQHRSYMCGNRMFVPYCLYSCYKHNCTLTWVYVCSHKKTPDKKGKYPALWFVKSASVTTKCP